MTQLRAPLLSLALLLTAVASGRPGAPEGPVLVVEVKGVIDPYVQKFVERALVRAEEEEAQALVLLVNTPGGLDQSMRGIVERILGSPVPVILYVHPSGARAASAGVFLALAADVVAMAPGTNIGAAHPVDISGEAASDKVTNDAAAYIRAIARRMGRNESWAEEAVRKSVSATAEEALALGIADVVTPDLDELLAQLDGREVQRGEERAVLRTRGAEVIRLEMRPWEHFLHTLADPNVGYILLLVGIYALIYGLANPGVFSEVLGAVLVIMALVSFASLPVNYGALLLIVLAMALFIADIKAPTHGALTGGGILALVIGSFLLFTSTPTFSARLSWGLILPAALFSAGFFAFVVTKAITSQRRPVESGVEALVGARGVARSALRPRGIVHVLGEQWSAEAVGEGIEVGEPVEVVGRDGLTLTVRKAPAQGGPA